MALLNQYVGHDKWQKEIRKQEQFLHTFVWKGNSNNTLESFVTKHRMAFVKLTRCAEHVTYTLPSAHQRVQYLLNAIKTDDAQLVAAIANVRADDQPPNGKMFDFESTANYIIPFDPVTGKRAGTKRKVHDIAAVSSDLGITRGPKTGVDIRYYPGDSYNNLTPEDSGGEI